MEKYQNLNDALFDDEQIIALAGWAEKFTHGTNLELEKATEQLSDEFDITIHNGPEMLRVEPGKGDRFVVALGRVQDAWTIDGVLQPGYDEFIDVMHQSIYSWEDGQMPAFKILVRHAKKVAKESDLFTKRNIYDVLREQRHISLARYALGTFLIRKEGDIE